MTRSSRVACEDAEAGNMPRQTTRTNHPVKRTLSIAREPRPQSVCGLSSLLENIFSWRRRDPPTRHALIRTASEVCAASFDSSYFDPQPREKIPRQEFVFTELHL